jgi:hypothetical protein
MRPNLIRSFSEVDEDSDCNFSDENDDQKNEKLEQKLIKINHELIIFLRAKPVLNLYYLC